MKKPTQNQLIGRKQEQLILKERLKSNRAEFIAVYGRRRIGKTFLIDRSYAKALERKLLTYEKVTKTKKQVFLAMITNQGLKTNIHSESLVDRTCSLDDLF